MAYDVALADRIRARLGAHPALVERQMFGGIGFMVGGNMAVGVVGDELMVRVGPQGHDEAIAQPGAHEFDTTGRPSRGWLLVSPDALRTDDELDGWVNRGVAFAESLPPK